MADRYALLIGTSRYDDPGLARLKAPDADVRALARVLRAPETCGFKEVVSVTDCGYGELLRHLAQFYTARRRDDLLLLYFSGHGIKDDAGQLYLAARDTERALLAGTAISSRYVGSLMDACASRSLVLMLDCCNAGAFSAGMKAAATMDAATAFQGNGMGRVVLTATDAVQFAWEGDQIIGSETENSLFTHFLIEGLETGAADRDNDGFITVDELYGYVYDEVLQRTHKQTPGRTVYKASGSLLLARTPPRPAEPPIEAPAAPPPAIAVPSPPPTAAPIPMTPPVVVSSAPAPIAEGLAAPRPATAGQQIRRVAERARAFAIPLAIAAALMTGGIARWGFTRGEAPAAAVGARLLERAAEPAGIPAPAPVFTPANTPARAPVPGPASMPAPADMPARARTQTPLIVPAPASTPASAPATGRAAGARGAPDPARAASPIPRSLPLPSPAVVTAGEPRANAASDEPKTANVVPPSTAHPMVPPPLPASETPHDAPRTDKPVEAAAEPPAIVPRDDPEQVRQVVRQYQRAYQLLDAAAVQRVWPGIPPSTLAQLRQSFARARAYEFALGNCAVAFATGMATATCTGTVSFEPKRGTATRAAVTATFHTKRGAGGWMIDGVDIRPQ